MRAMSAGTLSLFVAVVAVGAAPLLPPAETVRLVGECMRKQAKLDRQRRDATGEAAARDETARRRVMALQREYTAEEIARLESESKSKRQRADGLRRELACAEIRDAAGRAEKSAEVKKEASEAEEAFRAASAPFQEEEDRLRKELAPVDQELLSRLTKVGRVPAELGVLKALPRASVGTGRASVEWQDGAGKAVAHLTVGLSPSGMPLNGPGMPEREKIWGRFVLLRQTDAIVSFQVGGLHASFSPVRTDWQDKNKHEELAKALVDFDALELLRADVECEGELKAKVAEGIRRNREVAARRRVAAAGQYARVSSAHRMMRELGRPYDERRVEILQVQSRSCDTDADTAEAVLAVASMTDVAQRRQARERAEKEAAEAAEALAKASAGSRSAEAKLRKETKRAEFHLWELVDTVVRVPQESGVADAVVSASPSEGVAHIEYTDALGKQLAYVRLGFVPVPDRMQEQAKLAGKYPVQAWGTERAIVWLGGVRADVSVRKPEWQTKKAILDMTAALLDLDVIASWPRMPAGE